jgi:hypothetical protein
MTPRRPSRFINRCTLHRATSNRSRRICRQTLRTPQTWKSSFQILSTSGDSISSTFARFDRRSDAA